MTVVFRSCLPRFYSNTHPSLSNDELSESHSSSTQSTSLQTNQTRGKRGPRYTRINETSQSLLTRLLGTIFGDNGSVKKRRKRRNKKSVLPSQSTLEKQFEENQQTLNSFVTLLAQVESNEGHRARNNNRIDDAYIFTSRGGGDLLNVNL